MLDLWLPEGDARPDAAAMLGLFFYLTSAAATYAERDVRGWLAEAGFEHDQAGRDPPPAGPGAVRGPEA